ncbi:hypothetical protein [Sanguibacter gelidistatuariae]|uniref:hypothetical protein n=1 Tax=Sanguibacter gelidistatuariae TaxID=1814289 RepID=UPI00111370F4|nr:hypothetical protein [Sanguibacter gelidistatuariae]
MRGDDPLRWSPDALSALLRRLPGPVATEDLAPLTDLLLAWVPYTCRVRDVAPDTIRQMVPAPPGQDPHLPRHP